MLRKILKCVKKPRAIKGEGLRDIVERLEKEPEISKKHAEMQKMCRRFGGWGL